MVACPVFIVGSPRSGTSVLVSALLNAGYAGFYEGNFLSVIRMVDRVVDQHMRSFYSDDSRVLMSAVDAAELKERLFVVIGEEAKRHQPAGPWVDKTGGADMIDAIPTLRRLYPGARFVFARRRAIENVVSRLVKFPGLGFEYHCMDWARTMAAWRRLRALWPGSDLVEVDQQELSMRPGDVAGRLGRFLEMDDDAVDRMTAVFGKQRPQQTRPGSAGKIFALAELDWSAEQKAVFTKHCGVQMRLAGYSLNGSYWRR